MEKEIWNHTQTVRAASPLICNITNYVVMNNTANALLAAGASPVMAHAHAEIEDMVSICQAVVVNIGTLDEYWATSMLKAARKARLTGKPWLLDPVGAGATPYRDEVLSQLLEHHPTVIRGNASEILALAKSNTSATRGVDSTAESRDAVDAARSLAASSGAVICISGKTDVIVGKDATWYIDNGSPLMTRVTGLGCAASAVMGAFIAAIQPAESAVCAAAALFSICGELAAVQSPGPGSLQVRLLDKLYNITEREFLNTLRIASA